MKKGTIIECCNCGNNIKDDEGYERDDSTYCIHCYEDLFQFYCPICEDYHDKTGTPEKTFFYLHLQHGNLKPGYYRVKQFPVFRSDYFEAWILEENAELVSENICYKADGKFEQTEFICENCFNEKGLTQWRVECHIKQAMNKAFKPRKYKNWNSITVKVSPEYFKVLGGNIRFQKVQIKEDTAKKTQQLSVQFEIETVS